MSTGRKALIGLAVLVLGIQLKIYLPLHPEARLSVADMETLIDWSRSARASGESPPAE